MVQRRYVFKSLKQLKERSADAVDMGMCSTRCLCKKDLWKIYGWNTCTGLAVHPGPGPVAMSYLTEQEVNDVEDHAEREFGCEEGEKPLGGVHVSFQAQVHEVVIQVRQLLLKVQWRRYNM
ncbi:UNVERIFIED_CONTAM: hypothetical protein FKN15_052307 [Acipenser sinensis]